MFQGSFDQGGQVGCHGAAATPETRTPKHGRGKHSHIGKDVLFEFACAEDSNLGKVRHDNGLRVIRLCKEDINLEDPHSIEQLIAQVTALKGCSIHGSIECRPWSQWQHLNRTKYPRLAARISKEQTESAALVEQLIRVANICLDNGGDCSFEWPRYCTGWALPSIQLCILERNLHSFQWVLRRSSSRRPASKEAMEIHHIFIALGREPCNPEVYSQYSRPTTRQMD